MDLTKQPPRRPSNLSIAGIVGLSRMTDKARAYNNETLGEYLYGGDSGLDRKILDFLSISDEQFAEAVEEYDDQALDTWVIEQSARTTSEIERLLCCFPFTSAHGALSQEPRHSIPRIENMPSSVVSCTSMPSLFFK